MDKIHEAMYVTAKANRNTAKDEKSRTYWQGVMDRITVLYCK